VAERDGIALGTEHPGGQTRLELGELVRRDPLEQPDLRAGRRDGHGLEQPPGGSAEAGGAREHGVAHAAGRARIVAREQLGDEERIAAGASVQPGAVDAVRRGEPRDGDRRERLDRHPMSAAQLAEHHAERVIAPQLVVAVGRDHQRRHPRQPAAKEVDDVERRLVSPVKILEYDDARPAERAAQRHDHLARGGATLGHLRQLAADL
jgi:hypothetical protein